MDNIQQQIDDIISRLDDNDSSLTDFSDSLDNSINDLQNAIDDQSQSVSDLQENAGQLQFPLTQDTIDLIKEQFPCGKITLVAGYFTLTDPRISTNSVILMTLVAENGTRGTALPIVTASTGSAVFRGTGDGDTSTYNYLIL